MVETKTPTVTAKDVAGIFINELNCRFDNTIDGNMKLQKLLVFANLINITKNNKQLFSDDMSAFKNGIVVESIRKPFYEQYYSFMESLTDYEYNNLSNEDLESIKLSVDLFYELSSSELSELHHEFDTWKKVFDRSIVNEDSYDKDKAVIRYDEIESSDLERLKMVIECENDDEIDSSVTFNGIRFNYNSNEITLTPSIINYLKESALHENSEEKDFCLVTDENLGVYYY